MAALKPQMVLDNNYALALKTLHRSGRPVVFTNIWDFASTNSLLSLDSSSLGTSDPTVQAVATASFAIASTLSIKDEELSLAQNLSVISSISPLVRAAGIPLSIDLQDGYGDRIVEAVQGAISIGAVGVNIEDSYPERGHADGLTCLRSVEEAADRIQIALATARAMGIPDFVVNARTDVLRLAPSPEGWSREMLLAETIKRGKAYLEAGAPCVFPWGGAAGDISTDEVKILVKEFDGKLAVKLSKAKNGLSVQELAAIGVCRISIGPSLYTDDMEKFRSGAKRILAGGQLWNET